VVRFDWEEAKRKANIRKHGIDFVGAEAVFDGRQQKMSRKATSQKSQSGEAIDLSDIPEVPPAVFAKGLVRKGLKPVGRKAQITLRIDADVIDWFRHRGRGYQTRINSILRAYKDAHCGA
jgi:uncharacterized protein (DUF4415 family)